MDYEKKYNEALEVLRRIKAANADNAALIDFINYNYPELVESEDEKVRKEIIQFIKNTEGQTIPIDKYNNWIAWLEKQKDCEAEIEKAYKNADEVQYRRGYEDGVKSFRWTEEDEDRMNDALRILSVSGSCSFSLREEATKWLYELKNRLTN